MVMIRSQESNHRLPGPNSEVNTCRVRAGAAHTRNIESAEKLCYEHKKKLSRHVSPVTQVKTFEDLLKANIRNTSYTRPTPYPPGKVFLGYC